MRAVKPYLQYSQYIRRNNRRRIVLMSSVSLSIAAIVAFFQWKSFLLTNLEAGVSSLHRQEFLAAKVHFEKIKEWSVPWLLNWYGQGDSLLKETYYREASIAIEKGRFEMARKGIDTLLIMDRMYKDALNLRKETYYRPAQAAMKAGNWDQAIGQFVMLMPADSAYRQTTMNLCESYYQSSILSLQNKEWEKAVGRVKQLIGLRGYGYKKTEDLLKRSYFEPAVDAMKRKNWDDAIQWFDQLFTLDTNYRNSRDLVAKCYYGATTAAIESANWDKALGAIQAGKKCNPGDQRLRKLYIDYLKNSGREHYVGAIARAVNTGSSTIRAELASVAFSQTGEMFVTVNLINESGDNTFIFVPLSISVTVAGTRFELDYSSLESLFSRRALIDIAASSAREFRIPFGQMKATFEAVQCFDFQFGDNFTFNDVCIQ